MPHSKLGALQDHAFCNTPENTARKQNHRILAIQGLQVAAAAAATAAAAA